MAGFAVNASGKRFLLASADPGKKPARHCIVSNCDRGNHRFWRIVRTMLFQGKADAADAHGIAALLYRHMPVFVMCLQSGLKQDGGVFV